MNRLKSSMGNNYPVEEMLNCTLRRVKQKDLTPVECWKTNRSMKNGKLGARFEMRFYRSNLRDFGKLILQILL